VVPIYQSDHGYLILLKILLTVDDTKMVNNSILKELKENLLDVILHKNGSLLILSIICGLQSKYFDNIKELLLPTMIPSDENPEILIPSSKKDFEVRRKELFDYILNDLVGVIINNISKIIRNLHGINILEELYDFLSQENKDLINNKIFDCISDSFLPGVEQGMNLQHILNDRFTHRIVKSLIKKDNVFAENIFKIVKGNIFAFCLGKFSCHVILSLLHNEETKDKCKKEVDHHLTFIQDNNELKGTNDIMEEINK